MQTITEALQYAARINLRPYDIIERAKRSATAEQFLAAIKRGHEGDGV